LKEEKKEIDTLILPKLAEETKPIPPPSEEAPSIYSV